MHALLFCNFTLSLLQLYFKVNTLPSCEVNFIQVSQWFTLFFGLVFCFRISDYENTENRVTISNELKLNVDLFSVYFSIQVHWCIDPLILHTRTVYEILCSKGVFTDALSGNSHPKPFISHILHTPSVLSLPICTIFTFICPSFCPRYVVLQSQEFCNSQESCKEKLVTFCYFHKCLSEDPKEMFSIELPEKLFLCEDVKSISSWEQLLPFPRFHSVFEQTGMCTSSPQILITYGRNSNTVGYERATEQSNQDLSTGFRPR